MTKIKDPSRILANRYPHLVEEWHAERNGELTPYDVTYGSGKKVWWRCSKCNYEWETRISHRSNGAGCPECAKKTTSQKLSTVKASSAILANRHPHLVKEWHPTNNGDLTPYEVAHGSGKKVWWLCSTCGYEWDTVISNRSKGCGCPKCKQSTRTSFSEKAIIYYFAKVVDVIEQYQLDGSKMSLDVFIPSLNVGIEYDGKMWHQNKERDIKKDILCKKLGITLYRIREAGCVEIEESSSIIYKVKANSYTELENIIYELIYILTSKKINININSDRLKIEEIVLMDYENNSLLNNYPELCKEWNFAKNGKLLPKNFASKSNKKVWWQCSKCSYEWEAQISKRTIGRSCPACAGKVPTERNRLDAINPILAKEWHPIKNGELSPANVTFGSHKKVWWQCSICSHEWQAQISNRSNGNCCPACTGKVVTERNNLAVTHPHFIKEWHTTKNELTPKQVTFGSHKKVWWKCSKCSYEWMASINKRSSGRGCPACANRVVTEWNNLKATHPDLAEEWHMTKNKLTPQKVVSGSNKKVWWKCSKCSCEWQSIIVSRTKGNKCPKCAPKKNKLKPAVKRPPSKRNSSRSSMQSSTLSNNPKPPQLNMSIR